MNTSMYQQSTDPWVDIEPPSNMSNSWSERNLVSTMSVNENLLLEAQNESSRGNSKSSHSSCSSPRSPRSPMESADWISNWSSRIEAEPPKEWKFLQSIDRQAASEDDDEESAAEESLIERKHLPYVILSNCASFILGMGIVYICLRRYLRLKTPYFYSLE